MGSNSLVIQSHRTPLPFAWLEDCLQTVREWSEYQGFDYRFIGDELFDPVPTDILQKTESQIVIATDIARLYQLRSELDKYEQVIWCDADFLIFDPERFKPVDQLFAVGREAWVQHDSDGKLKCYRKVHNAYLMFRRGNAFLDFYLESAKRLIRHNKGRMPPQFVGPKLLTALHNVVQCPVQEDAGMLSPMVIEDILNGDGPALQLFLKKTEYPLLAANLSSSVSDKVRHAASRIPELINKLKQGALRDT
jgi:hypothetical protein